MNTLSHLTALFSEFPGIGPRQAKRFVYFLLSKDPSYANELVKLISKIKEKVKICDSCFRFFNAEKPSSTCNICLDKSRDTCVLAIVSNDVDLENLEKSHSYKGLYFVLGGVVPILEKNPQEKIRARELEKIVNKKTGVENDENKNEKLQEVILAMSCNPEGEHTADYVKNLLSPMAEKSGFKITTLGRGLSTGTELEYSDADTLKNALSNRH